MAKTKMEKEAAELKEVENIIEEYEEIEKVKEEIKEDKIVTTEEKHTGPSYDELMSIVQQLATEIQTLKAEKNTTNSGSHDSGLNDILSALANRKSDREVSIVHNRELLGGLTTHLELSNAIIDFRHIGETRLLSWQQFEECASKYRTFFDAKIILVEKAYSEIAQQYNLPCNEGKTHILTQKDMTNIVKLSVPELEKFIETLSVEDKDTVFSYWLGKCYSREKGFYDRHKMDTLNRLSGGKFDNILLVMNGDGRNIPETK